MVPQTFGLKQVQGARQANRVRCITLGADCVEVEPEYRLSILGTNSHGRGAD